MGREQSTTSVSTAGAIKSKFKGRSCSFPVLLVVFIQTFIVASLVLIIPLVISFQSMQSSNNLSVNTGRSVADSLAVKIQTISGSLALNQLTATINEVNSDTLAMYETMMAYVDRANIQSIFENFAYAVKYKKVKLDMFYGTIDDQFILLQESGLGAILFVTPGNYFPNPNCSMCVNFANTWTAEQLKWVKIRDCNTASGTWDEKSWTAKDWEFANFTLRASGRPWFKQAATLTPATARPQYTDPYMYAGGGSVGETAGGIAGITVSYPFFDAAGKLMGVYGSDISFVDMHRMLKQFVQTPNSFMYVMTRKGNMIGTSGNESIIDDAGNLKLVNQSTTPNIKLTIQYLQNLLPANNIDYSLLGGQQSTYEVNGIYFQLQVMPQDPYYVIVNGAPKTDYTGNIDTVLEQLKVTLANDVKQIIGIAAGVFVAMVVVSCILTYFSVTVPLAMITKIMVQATSFDFSAFKAMENQNANIITELGTMEEVFYKMIEKFASSIKANRELSGAGGAQSSQMNSGFKK
ncbi:UNVERIFIED_CONTAM: hypothetical protein HDU68_011675 [Siphonaria sp. JEL0065]|nr:hypothetical protein HDU68_011675 [Siphonaria sp. JEL0065]